MSLPGRLKAARSALGLTQKQFAAQSGVSPRSYQGYEDGRSVPGGEAIEAFVRMGINANWLMTGDGPMLLKDLDVAAPVGLDLARLQLAIATVEEGLAASRRVMAPDKKAELVLAVYDLYQEPSITRERVLKLVKSAA